MKNNKILIVEDESIIGENLRHILIDHGYPNVDVAMDAAEAKELFAETPFDLVLMDINLGESEEQDGIDLIESLKKEHSFSHIYVTANSDSGTVQKASRTAPNGYIVKPFNKSSIYANVEMALTQHRKEETFSFSNKGMQHRLLISEVEHIKADGSYIFIHMLDGKRHYIRMTLIEFSEMYESTFIRIHKSILINKYQIKSFNSSFVLINGKKLPIGRTHKQGFIKAAKNISLLM